MLLKTLKATSNFYPRSPCGERLRFGCGNILVMSISIHALLAESDADMAVSYSKGIKISIHALLAESDNISHFFKPNKSNFYPRSPCGERPNANLRRHSGDNDFYPRSPCGERRPPSVTPAASRNFYPRSPCGERL